MDMELVRNIATLLGNHLNIKVALLFGSVSRAQARAESDLDLAAAGAPENHEGAWKRCELMTPPIPIRDR